MYKKLLAFIIVLLMMFSVGCANNDTPRYNHPQTENTEQNKDENNSSNTDKTKPDMSLPQVDKNPITKPENNLPEISIPNYQKPNNNLPQITLPPYQTPNQNLPEIDNIPSQTPDQSLPEIDDTTDGTNLIKPDQILPQINPEDIPEIDNEFEVEDMDTPDMGVFVPPSVDLPQVDLSPDGTIPSVMRGAWVSTVYNIDYPSYATNDSTVLARDIDNLVDNAMENKLNTIFFQVRPCSDALYPSAFYPWSSYLTGKLGLAPSNDFDPLDYIIKKCHQNDINLHAWLNPYRLSTTSTLDPSHPINNFPHTIMNVENKLYLNPAEPDSQQFILDGISEIINNYDIDGIHFDDYFYPETITNQDQTQFETYGKDYINIGDFRRDCVNTLIKNCNKLIKSMRPSVQFGISPAGVWANKSSNPLGSDTNGFESMYSIYCDSRLWCKAEYIDYIIPQLYWYIGQKGTDYKVLLDWWADVTKDTNTKLYIGIAGYKINSEPVWQDPQQVLDQMSLAETIASGYSIFSFKDTNLIHFEQSEN